MNSLQILLFLIAPAYLMGAAPVSSKNTTFVKDTTANNETVKETDYIEVEAFKNSSALADLSQKHDTSTSTAVDPTFDVDLAKVMGKERGNVDKGSLPRKGAPSVENDLPHPLAEIYFAKDDNSTKKSSSSPRKGAPVKEPSKPRKGAFESSTPSETETLLLPNNGTSNKTKPTASVDEFTHFDNLNGSNNNAEPYSINYTGLIVGLCVGVMLLTLLSVLSIRRIRNMWDQRQYKRLDFLIDGMYNDN